ncbi:endoplasmic reticulum resident protein 27 [Megalops cyprinoides]|uniref:endoplasmic reticulum resident protein 27 n=1 Tax=Megalops cyprinoides TaxID=118141 RepID=UPI001864219A|nr:endoplasmic reticulum resident protein 27 [Megalops cyprinoides]
MLFILFLSLLTTSATAKEKDSALPRLTDASAAQAFIDSAEVVVIGFFQGEDSFGYKEFLEAASEVSPLPVALCTERDVWAAYDITSDTISIFRKADLHQENLPLSESKKLDSEGLTRFFRINELRYITEYNAVTAVGLFNSEVKTHLLLFANRGSADFTKLKDRLGALAPEYSGKFLFVLVNGALQSNARSLGYFGLKSRDLPRVGIYDGDSDRKWLLPSGEISTERVKEFCDSFLQGTLQIS